MITASLGSVPSRPSGFELINDMYGFWTAFASEYNIT